VNAVYHREYSIREPVEVRILPTEITICSFPGPDRSISMAALRKRSFVSRRYRNRRIGEFLKELDLTEGRGTGLPKIMRALKRNGSPPPRFETDTGRTHFVVRFPVHPHAVSKSMPDLASSTSQVSEQVSEQVKRVLSFCAEAHSKKEILQQLGLSSAYMNYKRHIYPLFEKDLLEMTIPEKPKSRLQKYTLTDKGRKWLKESH
jgi:ATP-dependent DNA helicase RecG